jgi:hypothetical protein
MRNPPSSAAVVYPPKRLPITAGGKGEADLGSDQALRRATMVGCRSGIG